MGTNAAIHAQSHQSHKTWGSCTWTAAVRQAIHSQEEASARATLASATSASTTQSTGATASPVDSVEHFDAAPLPARRPESPSLDGPPDVLRGSTVAMQTFTATAPYQRRVRDITEDLQAVQARGDVLHEQQQLLEGVLNALASQHNGHDQNELVDLDTVSMPDGRTASQALRDAHLDEPAGLRADGQVTQSSLSRLQDSIREEQTKLTEGTQQKLIALQEAMHQRDLLIQLATQQLAAASQTDRQILGNIR